jgi:hypothetical protein
MEDFDFGGGWGVGRSSEELLRHVITRDGLEGQDACGFVGCFFSPLIGSGGAVGFYGEKEVAARQ